MKRSIVVFIILAIIAVVASTVFLKSINEKEEDLLVISGRVEADEILLATEIPGRLMNVNISEGMHLKAGEIVAVLDNRELKVKREETLKKIESLRANINAEKTNLEYIKKEIEHQIEEARKLLKVAEARKAQTEKDLRLKKQKYQRYKGLFEKAVISRDRFEEIETAYETAEDEQRVAEAQVERARTTLRKAMDARVKIDALKKRINSMNASLQSMNETLKLIDVRLSHTVIKSPVDGIVLKKTAEPGEVLNPGGAVGIMIDPSSLYVKTYLPEPLLGMVKRGDTVEVITDAFPESPVNGWICFISDRAEFTPREVQSKEERVKQVFETKVCFDREHPPEILKKGMPVDVRIVLVSQESG